MNTKYILWFGRDKHKIHLMDGNRGWGKTNTKYLWVQNPKKSRSQVAVMIKSDFQNPSGSQGSTARIRNQNSSRLWQKLANTYGCMQWKMGKNHPMVPPLDHFQGKNKKRSSLARIISASRQSFFANLTTFERRSGLKIFSLLKIAILKMGWLSKFQSHRSWGDAHLNLGAAQEPPN